MSLFSPALFIKTTTAQQQREQQHENSQLCTHARTHTYRPTYMPFSQLMKRKTLATYYLWLYDTRETKVLKIAGGKLVMQVEVLTLSSCWTVTGRRSLLPSRLTRLPNTGSVANAKLSLQIQHRTCRLLRLQETRLLPRYPRDALWQLKCCPTVVRITQTDRVSAWKEFSATVTFYSATCIVLYTHRCNRLNYRTASIRCSLSHTCNAEMSRTRDKQT